MPRLHIPPPDKDGKEDVELKKSFEALHHAEITSFVKQKATYNSNKSKAYALIWGQCTKPLQEKIKSHTDYENKIKGDPIQLLQLINSLSISYMQDRYQMAIISETYKSLFNCKQGEDESLSDYKSRFESSRDILLSQLGTQVVHLPKVAHADKDWDDRDKQKQDICYQRAHDKFEAYLFIENAYRPKYASLLKTLAEDFSLNQDRYPINLPDAHKALQERKYDSTYQELKDKRKQAQQDRDQAKQSQKDQEQSKQAADELPDSLSFAQMENRCYCCGSKQHFSNKCPLQDTKPRKDWAINKVAAKQVHHLIIAKP
jgi:hypothetical protein